MKYDILHESENNIRENLYLENDEFDEFWNEWKNDIVKTIRKYENKLKNKIEWAYVLESDIENEIDYLLECGKKLVVLARENGLIIYAKTKLKK